MEKILWINPSFLDYRIPLYEELNRKLEGRFHLLYSRERIPGRCHKKVCEVLGENAHFIDKEKQIQFGKSSAEFANTSVSIPFPKGLYSRIKQVRPSALIAEGFFQFTPWAVAYSVMHRVPLYIAYERTSHTERNCPIWRKLYRRFIGLFVKGYVVNGRLTKEYLQSQGVAERKIFTGAMCADSYNLKKQAEQFSDESKKAFAASVGLSHISGIRFIYVGRIIELKGVIYLLESWKRHHDAYPNDELLIVGTGELLSEYQARFSDVSSIRFAGGVDYSQIYKYYAISDVFVIPTLEDNWSLVVPEAMACGLPIACSIYNGCYPELVKKDVNGITFDPLDEQSIVTALSYFHGKDLIAMGRNSVEIESHFSPSDVADNIISALKK